MGMSLSPSFLTPIVVLGKGSQEPFMEHRRRFKDIRQFEPTARYLVRFRGSQDVSECENVDASERTVSRKVVEHSEYSFVNIKGMQSTIP